MTDTHGRGRRLWRPFEESRDFARTLGLQDKQEWKAYCASGQKPDDIPTAPDQLDHYRGQWRGYRDWLGAKRKGRNWPPFKEAREYMHGLGLQSIVEWEEWKRSGRRPSDIPAAPWQVYEGEWEGYRDWLGYTDDPVSRWRPFEEAREFARTLGLQGQAEWDAYCKSGDRPHDIPSRVNTAYREEWRGIRDWLGTSWRPFEEARAFVRDLGLKNRAEWWEWMRAEGPPDIPLSPQRVYKEQWRGVGDWLGTDIAGTHDRVYRPFEEAREFVRSLGLGGQTEWVEWAKTADKPADIPATPHAVYRSEWRGTRDWLGFERWRPFEEAREFARGLGLAGEHEWFPWTRSGSRPHDIPARPDLSYQDKGWSGMRDWLGTSPQPYRGGHGAVGEWRSFEEAREYVRSLQLANYSEWKAWKASGKRPVDIPANPEKVYGNKWKRR